MTMDGVIWKIAICAALVGLAALNLGARFNVALILLVMSMVVGFLILDRK